MVQNDRARRMIDYYASAALVFLDTYTIVLLALERLCGVKKVQKFGSLISELSSAIKHLHEQGVVSQLHSGLPDNIESCLLRYEQLSLIKIQTYASKDEGRAEFVVVPEESRTAIQDHVQYMNSVRPVS